jgi:hypothetical protein
MMNQKEIMMLCVVVLATVCVSLLMNYLINMLAKDIKLKVDGVPLSQINDAHKAGVNNADLLQKPLVVASFDSVYPVANSVLMAVYVALGFVLANQAQKAKLF